MSDLNESCCSYALGPTLNHSSFSAFVMRIALFGATGLASGRLLVLAEGDTVRAPARNLEKLQPLSLAGLTVITGDVLDLAAIHDTI
jgi:hypothetical protein